MIESLLLMILVGCFLGIFTGLAPGIHVNTIAVIALQFSQSNSFELVALIVSMSIVHTFVDFIPSIILAVPGEDNFLSVLPGQRLFLRGKGHYAVLLTVWGGVVAGTTAIAVFAIFIKFLQQSIEGIAKAIPFVLAAVLALMVLNEKGLRRKLLSIAVIALSALLGIIALSPASSVKNPLLVLILGFYGVAPLLCSIKNKPIARKQGIGKEKISGKKVLENSLLSILGASFVSMFPGVGPNEAALIIRTLVGKIKASSYLVLLGGINTCNMLFSVAALYAVGKTRTGTAAAIKQLIELQQEHMVVLAAVSLIAIAFGAIVTVIISKKLLRTVSLLDYSKINLFVLALLLIIVLFLSNLHGLVAFAAATFIGLGTITAGLKKGQCMAFLMAPAILYYL